MEKKYSRPINENFYEEEDVEKIGNHIDRWLADVACLICRAKKWGVSKTLYTGTNFNLGQDKHVHNKVDLRIKALCQECGYIVEFDAEKAGIQSRQATEIIVTGKAGKNEGSNNA